jgi:integrase
MSPFWHYQMRERLRPVTSGGKSVDTMEIMKKPWIYKRKNVKGWWVAWYENGKRKAKALPTKSLAEHFRHIKYTQLNSDVFTGVIDFDWRQVLEEYKRYKQVEGLAEVFIYEVILTLRHFERLAKRNLSKEITQQSLDAFVLNRSAEVKKSTLNKDIRNLHAFLNWAARNRFVVPCLKVKKVKVAQKPVTSLSPQQVKHLIMTASRYSALRLRILLAVTTGLRRGNIEAIRIGDIHFDPPVLDNPNPSVRPIVKTITL